MRIGSKIVLLALIIIGCKKADKKEFETPYIDTALVRSEYNTDRFDLIIGDVDSVEQLMWISVGNKIDSLKERNKTLERKLGKSVRVIDKDGNVKNLGTLEDIKKRLKKNKTEKQK